VVEAAGGQVTDWTGGPPSGDGRIIAVGDARVREDALVAFRRGVR
jgi:fructose-1,6-bisphosphatase/inositol monophosphatase family enzyme